MFMLFILFVNKLRQKNDNKRKIINIYQSHRYYYMLKINYSFYI